MSLRRLPVAALLAAVVAVLAHVAGAGFDHAPGAARAPGLLGSLGAALALALLGAFFAGALRGVRPAIATHRIRGKTLAGLAAGGFAGFVAIEALEGHLALGGALRALAAVVPAALLVLLTARALRRSAGRAGAWFASFARSRGAAGAALVASPGRRRLAAPDSPGRSGARGRAPPFAA